MFDQIETSTSPGIPRPFDRGVENLMSVVDIGMGNLTPYGRGRGKFKKVALKSW